MKKLTLSETCFNHCSAEQQKDAIIALGKASFAFGNDIFEWAFQKCWTNTGVAYEKCLLQTVHNSLGAWMIAIHEDEKPELVTVLLYWGLNIRVLTGEAPLSDWGHHGLYLIEDVPVEVIAFFEKSQETNYAALDGIIKKYKETGVWDEGMYDED